MRVLGIESSCDECAIAIVDDGERILSSVIRSQIEDHKPYDGVVPELASRLHAEIVVDVYRQALQNANVSETSIEGIAVTSKPGLVGSLLVGLSFAKGLAFAWNKPLVGVDHILAHLYAPQLEKRIDYPYLGLLVSGGHTLITVVSDFDQVEILGTTIDDAVGEAFDKVAKFYGLGYPGGKVIDDLAKTGDDRAFSFPKPRLGKGDHLYDVSYSGLKTAVVNQKKQFLRPGAEDTLPNLCASFQKVAVDTLIDRLKLASKNTGIRRIVAGGGVAANSYLRKTLKEQGSWDVSYPGLELCSDNGAMIAGIGNSYLERGDRDGWDLNAESRVARFKRKYP